MSKEIIGEQSNAMIVEMISIDKLKAASYNPRRLSQHDFESLQRSIDEFGFVEPVVVNKRNGVIVGGHQRVQAGRAIGLKEVPVTYVDLNDTKERALNVALNKISGEFDTELLDELLRGLDDDERLLTGFTDEEILKLSDGDIDFEKDDKPKVKKYSVEELREFTRHYRFPEQASIISAFLDSLG